MPRINPYSVIVFSKGKSDFTHTGRWFEKYGFTDAVWVLSPGDDREEYIKSTGCPAIVSDSHNLPSKRQWALDYFGKRPGPWVLFFEDNIKRVTRVSQSHYELDKIDPTSRELFHTDEVSPQQVIVNMLQDIQQAEKIGAYLGGYATNDNHFFRKKKYRTVAFVWTKIGYMRTGGPRWPVEFDEKDDYAMTAECLKHSGRVLVNNYLYPWHHRFEGRGGSPTLEQRTPGKREAVKRLLEKYPGLFREKGRQGLPEGTEVQLRFSSENQVDKWRQQIWEEEE